jgi:uncharacterized membrane protein YjjP (DUF1212 family)
MTAASGRFHFAMTHSPRWRRYFLHVSELFDSLDNCLGVGELIQASGGHTTRTLDTMYRMAAALGIEESHIAVSSVNVTMSATVGDHTRTAMRHAAHFGINFAALTEIKHLVAAVERGELDNAGIRIRLAQIRQMPRPYPTWLVMVALGGSTAAFAALFHGSPAMIALAFLGGWAGGWVRHLLTTRHMLPFVAVTCAAFASALLIAGGAELLDLGDHAVPALSASTLFLVPGVPMLNGTADELTGNYLNGLVKLAMTAVIVLSAAVGLGLAVALAEVIA